MLWRFISITLAACCGACAQIPGSFLDVDGHHTEPYSQVQGFVGIMDVDAQPVQLNPALGTIVEDDDPTAGVLGTVVSIPYVIRNRFDFGGEAGVTYSGSTEGGLINNGSAIVASDVDITLSDFFMGLYFNVLLANHLRFYVSGGPVLQYGDLDYEFRNGAGNRVNVGDSGFGGGIYARAGIEVEIRPGHYAGFGARWIDSSVNLSGGLTDYEYEAFQFLFTVTTGY